MIDFQKEGDGSGGWGDRGGLNRCAAELWMNWSLFRIWHANCSCRNQQWETVYLTEFERRTFTIQNDGALEAFPPQDCVGAHTVDLWFFFLPPLPRFTIKPFCTQELGPQISLTWVWDIWLLVLTGEGAQEGSEQQVREFFQTSADIHVRWDHCSLQVCYLSRQRGSKKAFIISLSGRTQPTEGEMRQVLILMKS